ncbi:hypothetical protein J2848_006811 [Azospirillum lipoferum]|uniref:Uncharacterized protein n=1 Tax=Azospirillum lipoferum TaxID=193 RepID=A0A5A9G0F6_AZOLI|nr:MULTISPECIES: hypothetical protein [Azospirillum]KAA0587174.1 hypothetical protein FZ942_34350 [Azospirillum lipoferum]MCP1615098.1 hypothetical protein [Azospirillum lipoferum]MDW5532996.1 hypothetical protein [Azospirillum sp. NL1]
MSSRLTRVSEVLGIIGFFLALPGSLVDVRTLYSNTVSTWKAPVVAEDAGPHGAGGAQTPIELSAAVAEQPKEPRRDVVNQSKVTTKDVVTIADLRAARFIIR